MPVTTEQHRKNQASACQQTGLSSRLRGQPNSSPGVEWQAGHLRSEVTATVRILPAQDCLKEGAIPVIQAHRKAAGFCSHIQFIESQRLLRLQ